MQQPVNAVREDPRRVPERTRDLPNLRSVIALTRLDRVIDREIHPKHQRLSCPVMDAPVKPGHDGVGVTASNTRPTLGDRYGRVPRP
ncbi:hypothetical protein, partial [Pseudooceanicola nanhaiensis]|uniref:hypothetical protein n=1 Tax=Pseudooceanicola nanhaiensis TaxID=375761 RepID=UPI004058306C